MEIQTLNETEIEMVSGGQILTRSDADTVDFLISIGVPREEAILTICVLNGTGTLNG
jgi:hypothetical protein